MKPTSLLFALAFLFSSASLTASAYSENFFGDQEDAIFFQLLQDGQREGLAHFGHCYTHLLASKSNNSSMRALKDLAIDIKSSLIQFSREHPTSEKMLEIVEDHSKINLNNAWIQRGFERPSIPVSQTTRLNAFVNSSLLNYRDQTLPRTLKGPLTQETKAAYYDLSSALHALIADVQSLED